MTRRMNSQLMIEVRQSQCPYQVRIHNKYVHIYICIFIDSNLLCFFHFYWFQNGIKDAAYYQVDNGAVLRASQQHVVFINLFMQPANRYLLFFSLNIFYFDNVCFHWIATFAAQRQTRRRTVWILITVISLLSIIWSYYYLKTEKSTWLHGERLVTWMRFSSALSTIFVCKRELAVKICIAPVNFNIPLVLWQG